MPEEQTAAINQFEIVIDKIQPSALGMKLEEHRAEWIDQLDKAWERDMAAIGMAKLPGGVLEMYEKIALKPKGVGGSQNRAHLCAVVALMETGNEVAWQNDKLVKLITKSVIRSVKQEAGGDDEYDKLLDQWDKGKGETYSLLTAARIVRDAVQETFGDNWPDEKTEEIDQAIDEETIGLLLKFLVGKGDPSKLLQENPDQMEKLGRALGIIEGELDPQETPKVFKDLTELRIKWRGELGFAMEDMPDVGSLTAFLDVYGKILKSGPQILPAEIGRVENANLQKILEKVAEGQQAILEVKRLRETVLRASAEAEDQRSADTVQENQAELNATAANALINADIDLLSTADSPADVISQLKSDEVKRILEILRPIEDTELKKTLLALPQVEFKVTGRGGDESSFNWKEARVEILNPQPVHAYGLAVELFQHLGLDLDQFKGLPKPRGSGLKPWIEGLKSFQKRLVKELLKTEGGQQGDLKDDYDDIIGRDLYKKLGDIINNDGQVIAGRINKLVNL